MISFAKYIAVCAAALIATTALAEKSGDDKASTPDPKAAGKKPKKPKAPKTSDDPNGGKKSMDIPVISGHDSLGLHIPYFTADGKRQMNFTIGVASRIDETHVRMTNMQVETFNDEGEHEMTIDLPTSVFDTESSAITTNYHVTINREDFQLSGETMIFYTRTKQGGLGGHVRMLIYNREDSTKSEGAKDPADVPHPIAKPDEFKTPLSRQPLSDIKPDKFNTPASQAK